MVIKSKHAAALLASAARFFSPNGTVVNDKDLKEGQTSHITSLRHEFANHPSRGLTPSKLAAILDAAEQGDIVGQYELFEDMEEKDGHIMSEMGKRRRAIIGLDWSIVPPDNASAQEKKSAAILNELLKAEDDFEEILFDITDAIGKGFACLEFDGWQKLEGYRVPKAVIHRPQSWFQLVRGQRQEIRLRGSAAGEPLQPFGWITHVHKAKSGYLERSALFRVLVWPYLFKNYSVGDLAEFLEIYGIPMRVGKYPSGATDKEKLTLLRALAQLGHNAAGIIPNGMELDFLNAAQGDPAAFQLMIDWCEKTQSKAILGGTLTSQADGKSSTNALGNVHNEVRMDLRDADAKQIQKTISRDWVYPMAVLNGLADSWNRCPRFEFNTQDPEDMKVYSEALPTLVDMGFKIPRQWAQSKVAIPEPQPDEEILTRQAFVQPAVPPATDVASANAEITAKITTTGNPNTPAQQMLPQVQETISPAVDGWIEQIRTLMNEAGTLDELRDRLLEQYPDMTLDQYAAAMGDALTAASLAGRNSIVEESHNG
jgi:phage gp29-like protein